MAVDFAFLFCVEPGSLEPKARLLVESIRRWGGRAGRAPIFAYQPRGTDALAPETHWLFERLHVEHRAGSFNRDDAENPYANKVHACAHLARSSSCSVIAFLDTDTVLLNEPTALMIEAGTELAVTPVVKKYAGTSGRRSDVNDPLWRRLYAAAGVEPPPFVHTVYDGARIRAY